MNTTKLYTILERFKKGHTNTKETHNEIANYLLDQYKEVLDKANEQGYNDGIQRFLNTEKKPKKIKEAS
jgi:hypothetical protein